MGLTYIEGTVSNNGKSKPVKFLIDSGASYSVLPQEVWKGLKLKPKRSMSFTLADGTQIKRRISECHFALAGEEGHSPVILGEPGDVALLGAVTLEIFGLVLNPFQRTLQPMTMHLA